MSRVFDKICYKGYNKQMENKRGHPKRYKSKFIEPGLISYEDVGMGTVFVRRPALDKMRGTFIGKPIFNFTHKDITPEDAFNLSEEDRNALADGIISEVGYDESTGWDYVQAMIWDEETKKNIDKNGFSVSCAYVPTEVTGGGNHNGIPYDEEVLNGYYTHLAVVADPRYEGAVIYENSVTKKESKNMLFKIFNNKKEDEEKDKKEVTLDNAMIKTPDGEEMKLEDAVNAYKAQEKEKKENEKKEESYLNMDDEVEVEGKKVKVKDLVSSYKKSKNNAEPAQDEEAEPVVKENSKPKEDKPNSNFKSLQNSATQVEKHKPNINTQKKRLDRGKVRYGKVVNNKGDK